LERETADDRYLVDMEIECKGASESAEAENRVKMKGSQHLTGIYRYSSTYGGVTS
jgi:hypothetical protein